MIIKYSKPFLSKRNGRLFRIFIHVLKNGFSRGMNIQCTAIHPTLQPAILFPHIPLLSEFLDISNFIYSTCKWGSLICIIRPKLFRNNILLNYGMHILYIYACFRDWVVINCYYFLNTIIIICILMSFDCV